MKINPRLNFSPKHSIFIAVCVLTVSIATLFMILFSTHANADTVTTTTITVSASCTLESGGGSYNATISPGTSSEITANTISARCNDNHGYAFYAVGYSNDTYSGTNTDLISNLGNDYNIKTNGTGTYGSDWKMKLTAGTDATITAPYTDYQNIPDSYAKVASHNTDTTSATITPSYQISVSTSQPAGTYTGKVKYVLVHPNDVGTPPIMQDATIEDCGLTMTDRRDGKTYTTALINGQCWMTQNLRITGTISAIDSNFTGGSDPSSHSFNVSEYSLDANDSSYTNHCDDVNGYNYACAKDSGNDTTGTWYNFAAASAGTITGSSNDTPATQDICPAGWHLPSGPNTTVGTDINKLVGNTISDWQPVTAGLVAFNAVAGGNYYNGSIRMVESGLWWSSVAPAAHNRYVMDYKSSNNQFLFNSMASRHIGFFIRCVKSTTIDDLIYMQDFAKLSDSQKEEVKASMTTGEQYKLIDKRDGSNYAIKKINDQIWMTQNLRITGTISAEDSNFTGNDFNVSEYSLDASDSSYANHCDDVNGYNYACAKDSGSVETGVWYNYYSASAGTISGGSNSTPATEDICPAGWHLPSGPNSTVGTDFNKLIGNTADGWQPATSGIIAFDAVEGGYYYNGTLYSIEVGVWWSATNHSESTRRYVMDFNGNSSQVLGVGAGLRPGGRVIRCLTQ